MLRHLPLIFKNCWRNRRRTILTVLSISVSLCLLGVMMAIYHAFYFKAPAAGEALRLIVRNRVSLAFPMPQAYREKILQVPGVADVGISQWFGGMYIDRRPEHMFARFGIEPPHVFRLRPELTMPEDQKKAFLNERTACIVGRKPRRRRRISKSGQKITIVGDIFPLQPRTHDPRHFRRTPNNDELLYFSRDYLEESLPVGPPRRSRDL